MKTQKLFGEDDAKLEDKEKAQAQAKQIDFVKMRHMDTGKTADVHPLEQLNYFRAGYRKLV